MKTASVLGAALALLAAPALAQYGDGAQNAGGPLGSYAPQGRDKLRLWWAIRRLCLIGPSYGPPAYSWGGPVYDGYPRYRGGPGNLAAPSTTRGGSIGRTRGSIGAGSDCCSAARPKARRSIQLGAPLRHRVGCAIA